MTKSWTCSAQSENHAQDTAERLGGLHYYDLHKYNLLICIRQKLF